MVYTTKYSKNQPKTRTKKFSGGGPVYRDLDVQTDEDEVDTQMANNRLNSDVANYQKDLDIINQSGSRRDGRYSPSQAVDIRAAEGRRESMTSSPRGDSYDNDTANNQKPTKRDYSRRRRS